MTSTAATLVLIDPKTREVIIGVRSPKAWVYPNADSLPGGFMEARFTKEQDSKYHELRKYVKEQTDWKEIADEYHEGEDAQDCMIREAKEELGVDLKASQLVMFDTRSNSRTDTRAHVTNVCFYALLTEDQSSQLPDGLDVSDLDDLASIKRWRIDDVLVSNNETTPMAFNHFEILVDGIMAWKKNTRYEELEAENKQLKNTIQDLRNQVSNYSWNMSYIDNRQGGL